MSETEEHLNGLSEESIELTKSGQICDNFVDNCDNNLDENEFKSENDFNKSIDRNDGPIDSDFRTDSMSSGINVTESQNLLKRSKDSDNYENSIKRIKTNDTFDGFVLNSSDCDLSSNGFETHSSVDSNDRKSIDNRSNGINDHQLVSYYPNSDNTVCDMSDTKEFEPKKTPKQVKWRQSIVNPDFNEDSLLNLFLSKTYYYYGTGIVTGEAGDMFGGNRFQGFSRHLLSDSIGITVELCKPFIINQILIELEDKSHKKNPLFAYKVLIAIDECMTDWHLIKDFDEMVCFGQQIIRFYPRIVQYIRIVGKHGIYCEDTNETTEGRKESEARYFTLLNFDCIFDQKSIQ